MRLLNEAEDVSLHYHHCYFIEKFVCNTATKNRMVDKVFFFKYNTQCHKTVTFEIYTYKVYNYYTNFRMYFKHRIGNNHNSIIWPDCNITLFYY